MGPFGGGRTSSLWRRGVRAGALVGAASMLTGCLGWSQWGYDAGRSSHNPHETALTPTSVTGLAQDWRSLIGDTWSGGVEVAVKGSRVVVIANPFQPGSHMYGLDAATGDVVWDHPEIGGRPIIRDDVVYTARKVVPGNCEESAMAAWDLETGAPRPDDDILAWEDTHCDGPGLEAFGSRYVLSAGSGFDGDVFVKSTRVYDLETGATTLHAIGPSTDADATAMDEELGAFVITATTHVEAVPLPGRTSPSWTRSIPRSNGGGTVLADGLVYTLRTGAPGEHDVIQVLDGATGADVWSARGRLQPTSTYFGRPAVKDGRVFATVRTTNPVQGELRVYDDCGAALCDPIWTAPGIGPVTDPVVAGDLVYVVTANPQSPTSELRVYDVDGCGAATCAPLHSVPLDVTMGDLVVVDGTVYVGSTLGVVALRLPQP